MTRLEELQALRDFIDREIAAENERLGATDPNCIRLISLAASLYDVTPDDILSRNRKHRVKLARHAACWLMRHQAGLTYQRIGKALDLDHTTVLHACRSIDASPPRRALLLGLEVLA